MVDDSSADVHEILSVWEVGAPARIEQLSRGSNNATFDVLAAGKRYILRVYPPTVRSEQIRYEHELLTRLGEVPLSFAVPAPIASPTGDTLVAVPAGGMAALFPFIRGEEAHDLDLTQTRALGAALGELDDALSTVHLDEIFGRMPPFEDLRTLHADVRDPLEIPRQLPLPVDQQDRLGQISFEIGRHNPVHVCDAAPADRAPGFRRK